MSSRHRFLPLCLTAILAGVAAAAAPAAKPVKKPPSPQMVIPVGPKKLTVVAGRPFESIPASGPSKLYMVMCAEETEPATFAVRYAQALPRVRVAAGTDLVGPGKIARTNVEVSRIAGDYLFNARSAASGAVYADTDIGPDPTPFWVNVTVPRRTPPGLYKGAISFYVQNKVFDVVNIEVKVLPMRLIGSCKQYIPLTPYGPAGQDGCKLSGDDYLRFLKAFSKLGFRTVSVNATPGDLEKALQAHESAGEIGKIPVLTYALAAIVPTVQDVQVMEAARRNAGCKPLLYAVLANPSTEAEIETACQQAQVFRLAGVRSIAAVTDESALERLGPLVDGVVYDLHAPYVQSLLDGRTVRTSSQVQWFSWNARRTPLENRINAGAAAWKSGLDGCMPVWMPSDGPWEREMNSLFAEALREGIDDTRYLTSYMKALRELKDLKRENDKDYIAATEAYLAKFMSRPVDQFRAADVDALRLKMAEFTMKLESML